MASLQAQVDSVKAAVSSPTTCTTATVVTLKKMLLPEVSDQSSTNSKLATQTTKQTTKVKTRGSAGASGAEEILSTKDRTALATHVINVTIKSLTEASKLQSPATPLKRQNPATEAPRSGAQGSLRRSLSAPLSPLQPRTLNRAATSPNAAPKATKNSTSTQKSAKYLTTAECARIALACLRSVKGPIKADQTDFQIENGMATLATKLLALGLNELASKELRMLKRRLEKGSGSELDSTSSEGTKATSDVCNLLDYHGIVSHNSISMVASCQVQSLRLIAASKKPAQIEGVLPYLRESHKLSPINILTKLAKFGEANVGKAARQMSSLSQTLLSLAPSVSSSEDNAAMEPRLSPSPPVAFELQSLAFKTQLRWWKLAGHQGKIDDDILAPFSRCVRCFIRRQASTSDSAYTSMATTFNDVMNLIQTQNHEPARSPNSPLASIYQSLGSAAQSARQYDKAHQWYSTLKSLMSPGDEASIRACSVSARLLAVALKRSELGTSDERLVETVIEGLNASLSGTAMEVNELLESLSLARRSVAGLLMNNWDENAAISPKLKVLLKKFLLRYPRFVVRWLGSTPGKDASTKHILQFDQRRQTIMQSVNQILDATLMVARCEIYSGAIEWQSLDDVLQDCTLLLNNLYDPALSPLKTEQLGAYHVKISTLYFTKFSQLRKNTSQSKADKKEALQALTRSIDAVKERSAAEREKAQLATKLELLAELCKAAGRPEQASKTLRSICTNMVEDGVLAKVATTLAVQPPRMAWSETEKASALSRSLRSIAKLDCSWNDWTFVLPEAERAAVLEHLLQISTEEPGLNKPLRLHDPGMTALLRIYSPDRYPIRRLRVLLKLFSQQIGQRDLVDEIATLLDQALRYLQKKDMAEDASLTQFIPHLRIYHSSVTALGNMDAPFPVSVIRDSVSSWAAMVDTCRSERDILAQIDEPEALLEHLLACNKLAGMKGESRLQVSVLQTAIKIAKVYTGPSSDDIISYNCNLATQYITVGLFTEASETLGEAKEIIRQNEGTSPTSMVNFYLSQAEYLAGIDDSKEALAYLEKAGEIDASRFQPKVQATLALAQSSLTRSHIFLRMGDIEEALRSARTSVKMLSQDWNRLEGPPMQANPRPEPSLAESVLGTGNPIGTSNAPFGSRLWTLAKPLFDSLMHLSSVYAHVGMFQETTYYCETALRIADGTQSSQFKAEASAWAASVYARSGALDKALDKLGDASNNIPEEASAARVRLARQISEVYGHLEEVEKAAEYLRLAEETTYLMGRISHPTDEATAPAETSVDATKGRGTAATRRTVAAKTTRTRATTTTRTQKRAPAAKSKAVPPTNIGPLPKDAYQASLLASVLLTRAMDSAQQKDWSSVTSTLELVKDLPKLQGVAHREQLITASKYISLSVEQMLGDPVFSVLRDSTISFPATSGGADKGGVERPSTSKSPQRKGRAAARSPKEKGGPAFAEALKQAQEVLLNAHASALENGDNSMMHRISTLLQNTGISLTAASMPKLDTTIQSDLTMVAVEMARNATWKREQLTIQSSKDTFDSVESSSQRPSMTGLSDEMARLGLTTDMTRFQDEFIELVPKNWSVISMSLSENRHDLCITKFQAGHSPFILRLPLERANLRDADSEVFNFQHGREELLDIIKNANRTSHSGGELATKASRNAWWAEREALDARLKDLLAVMETTWLGGFKGIFSQHQRRPDLLARFQKSFHQLLERSLPSRNGGGGGGGRRRKKETKVPAVTLDPRILDLFIGLGDPTDPDCEFDEALNDLLYFVVDVLQFHGERNAYDEIDFDAMVVGAYDALRAYYAAVKSEGGREAGAHTILVLDKSLHAFPWESMPCMEGLAVSRVPSLAALRRLITEVKAPEMTETDVDPPGGHYVSAKSGTYMLNPSSDLKNTQAYFEPSFNSLESWTGLVNQIPQETDFEKALSSSEVLLYFGHGGGAQYIRGKTVRRLEKCKPATFLMGCSSAALTEAGEFECYGPVWNYMTAGCPAVVGTLWDVTDRDIDRFAGRAFEEWGLFSRGTFKEGKKGKGKEVDRSPTSYVEEDDATENGSLAEAVTRARAACRFKYLNAAAVVMYGIPVYIERE